MDKLKIIDPTDGATPLLPSNLAGSDVLLDPRLPRNLLKPGTPICLFSNTKPGAVELLRAIGRSLEQSHGVRCTLIEKPSAGRTAPDEMLDEAGRRYKAAILATGECGSCTTWTVLDGLELQRRGLFAAVVVTTSFVPLAKVLLTSKNERVPAIVLRHPVGSLYGDALLARADDAVAQLVEREAQPA